ncbi:MAG: hypothetical protein WKG07_28980 [Hymenobacter sp.]
MTLAQLNAANPQIENGLGVGQIVTACSRPAPARAGAPPPPAKSPAASAARRPRAGPAYTVAQRRNPIRHRPPLPAYARGAD